MMCFFIVSAFLGAGLLPEKANAAGPPVEISNKELGIMKIPDFIKPKETIPNIDITVDLETNSVKVNGTDNAKVNVTTIGQPKPTVVTKWRTKREVINNGYPHTNLIDKFAKDSLTLRKQSFNQFTRYFDRREMSTGKKLWRIPGI